MKKILVGALVAISLVFVNCQTTEKELVPISIQNSVTDQVGTQTPTAPETPPPPTVKAETTPTAAQTVSDQTGKAVPLQPTPEPWTKPDWGWVRANWAATGRHDFLQGTITPCQKLARVVSLCFFTDALGRTVEFGYDGQRTYYLYYPIGDIKNDQNERRVELVAWSKINGNLLFPLNFCNGEDVTVLFLDQSAPSGFRTWC